MLRLSDSGNELDPPPPLPREDLRSGLVPSGSSGRLPGSEQDCGAALELPVSLWGKEPD